MRRFLTHLHRHSGNLCPLPPLPRTSTAKIILPFLRSRRLLSDDASAPPAEAPSPSPTPADAPPPPPPPPQSFADVSNEELNRRVEAYFKEVEESELLSVAEAVLRRQFADAHNETDDELIQKLPSMPVPGEVRDEDSGTDDDDQTTDEELRDLYNARQYVEKKMKEEEYFNMDETKWDDYVKRSTEKRDPSKMQAELSQSKANFFKYCRKNKIPMDDARWNEIVKETTGQSGVSNIKEGLDMDDTKWDETVKEATEQSGLSKMKVCEDILEDMLHYDKLLPDEIKQKVEDKFNELEDMCERGELEPEKAYELFKEFEDKMVSECTELMEPEPPTVDELSEQDNNSELDDPPGAGPVLRWESTIVFAPGGDAWHPKNRKVKLSVTVKELGLSRHAFRRLREVVGKRYNSGKDELTITSERFDHREENRKDCLRTLYALVEDAMKADVLADDARNAYVKGRLKANSQFMDRLKMKTQKLRQAAA